MQRNTEKDFLKIISINVAQTNSFVCLQKQKHLNFQVMMYLVQTEENQIVMITPDKSRAKSVALKLGGWVVDLPSTETIWF